MSDNTTSPYDGSSSSNSVTVDCSTDNGYDGRMGLRISSIFVILIGSLIGTLVPIVLARSTRLKVPKAFFFIAKYFGSGVIIATAFIHLLAPANDALTSPCFPDDSAILAYSWPEGIALMTIFVMFFIELLASRYEINLSNHAAHDPSRDLFSPKTTDEELGSGSSGHEHPTTTSKDATEEHSQKFTSDLSYPPGGQDHLSHKRDHSETARSDNFAMQMTALYILEFGVIFHSIFIGLTLAVSGDEFTILYIVLVFHQSFEGLGLGSRLAIAHWPKGKGWLPYVLGTAYALTTPLAIAAGLGARTTLQPDSLQTLMINGVFDSISAGILIYTGLVELMAHEFMFNADMRKSSLKVTLLAFGCMVLGAGLMALLGKWA